jgi:HrpA-like RNA helicase
LLYIVDEWPSGGAILVFLPGAGEILDAIQQFRTSVARQHGRDLRKFLLLPLHSALSTAEQQKVFMPPQPGVRKIVFATNIAETSITVADIEFVVDSGRMKETQFDPDRKMSLLVATWVSRANATQRRGRAGRVRSGHCFAMYSEQFFESTMASQQTPELHRTSLEHICLQVALISRGAWKSEKTISQFIASAIDPPNARNVDSAIETLQELSALDGDQLLTPLGDHLARLPVGNVRLGKMLIFGACFNCLTPILCIAALLSSKSPFYSPMEK